MLYTFSALLPFLILGFLLVILQRPAILSIPFVLVVSVITGIFVWGMDLEYFWVAGIKSFLVTLDVIYIITGVMILFVTLQKAGLFESFENLLTKLSSDRRVQALIVAWVFVSLLEGAAGFGTPGMLAAGILMHIGFRPLLAVVLPLIGGFVATTFGAIGVPLTIGIAEGINISPNSVLIQDVTNMTALFHLVLGTGIPLLLSCITTYISSGSWREGLALWKFSLFAGISFTAPMYVIATIIGPEFPSIGGAILSFILVLIALKKKLFLPETPYRFADDSNRVTRSLSESTIKSIIKTLIPYIFLVVLLGITRFPFLPFGDFLAMIKVSIPSIFGTPISHTITPLYSPGFFLILTAIFSLFYFKVPVVSFTSVLYETGKRIYLPFIILLTTLAFINVLLYSGNNSKNLPSILVYVSDLFLIQNHFWPFLSTSVGLVGAFVSGSVTVSNLLFSGLQFEAAIKQQYNPALTLTLQTIGSAAGNMIAIHNVIAALSIVHLRNKESSVIRITIIPAILYIIGAGILGSIIVRIGL